MVVEVLAPGHHNRPCPGFGGEVVSGQHLVFQTSWRPGPGSGRGIDHRQPKTLMEHKNPALTALEVAGWRARSSPTTMPRRSPHTTSPHRPPLPCYPERVRRLIDRRTTAVSRRRTSYQTCQAEAQNFAHAMDKARQRHIGLSRTLGQGLGL